MKMVKNMMFINKFRQILMKIDEIYFI